MPRIEYKETKKKICTECGIEKNDNQFYCSKEKDKERMDICKNCFKDEIRKSSDLFVVFKKYNIPYVYEIWDSIQCRYHGDELIGEYMKNISSLPQYRNLEWKDSTLYKEECETEVNFYDSIVKNLKNEAEKLNQRLEITRNRDDMNLYISTLKSLRETLDLISKYDWKLNYSEYKVKDDNDNWIKQISVWENNHENTIRNHKFWNVIE